MNSVIEPSRVMRPITFAVGSTYQRFPSGPAAMSVGSPGVGTGNSVTTPAFVTRAIAPSPPACATHRLPSGPVTIPRGLPVGKPAVNSVMIAPGVIRPTPLLVSSVNQRLPSGPWAMPQRPMLGVRPVLNSEIEGPTRRGDGGSRPEERGHEQRHDAGPEAHPGCIDTTVRRLMERLSARWPRPVKSVLRRWSCSSTSSSFSR